MYDININGHLNSTFKSLFIQFQLLYTNIEMARFAAGNVDEEIRNYELFYSTDKKVRNHNGLMEVNQNQNIVSTESPYFGMYFITTNEDINDVSMEDQTWIENFELKVSEESDNESTNSQNDHYRMDVDTTDMREMNNKNEMTFQKDTTLQTSKGGEQNVSLMETSVESKKEKNVSMEISCRKKRKIKRRSMQNQKTLFDYSYQLNTSLDKIRSSFVQSENCDASGTLIDVAKLTSQLMRAVVVLEKLPESTVKHISNTIMYNHYCKYCNKIVDNDTANRTKNMCKICDNQLKFQCNNCKIPLETYKLTVVHVRDCFQVKSRDLFYDCPGCDYKSRFTVNMNRHIIKYHREFVMNKMYTCEKCQKKIRKYVLFTKHFRACTAGR